MTGHNKFETRSYADATYEALTLLQKKLPVSNYNDIVNKNKDISWAGELFEGSVSEITVMLIWNLRRLQKSPGFENFYVGFDKLNVNAVEITAMFSRMCDIIVLMRTASQFFIFGNKSFVKPNLSDIERDEMLKNYTPLEKSPTKAGGKKTETIHSGASSDVNFGHILLIIIGLMLMLWYMFRPPQ